MRKAFGSSSVRKCPERKPGTGCERNPEAPAESNDKTVNNFFYFFMGKKCSGCVKV